MGILHGIILGCALAMDAFAVSLSIGLTRGVSLYNRVIFCISFAFFQGLLSFLGGLGGILFSQHITTIPSVIGGIIVAIVGLMMIKEGWEKGSGRDFEIMFMQKKMYFILGISVSIDAMVVGFTALNSIDSIFYLFDISLLIGAITLVSCVGANLLARSLKKVNFVKKYADYLGGVILLLFGLKMIFF